MEKKKLKIIDQKEKYLFDAVVEKSLLEDVPETEIYAAQILDKQRTSEIVIKLSKMLPILTYQHLKRVSGGRILLNENESESKVALESLSEEWGSGVLGPLGAVRVPQSAPRTCQQFTKANTTWPCHFHRDEQLEALLRGEPGGQQDWHQRWVAAAAEAGRRCRQGRGAVVARGPQLVVTGFDQTDKSPIRHAAMVAIDLVARLHGGGAWLPMLGSHVGRLPPELSSPYLCTDCDVYLSHEPCAMCAMALVHSRVRTVFFCEPDPVKGALFSCSRLHQLKPLNHHYRVFRVMTEKP